MHWTPPGPEPATGSRSRVVAGQDAADAPLEAVGAKAATLSRLAAAGVPVPELFVVSSAAFVHHLSENRIPWPQPAERAPELRDAVRSAPVPESIVEPVLDAYGALCRRSGQASVAVRSSGGEEDAPSASFAGQFASMLNVEGPGALLEAVKRCWASYLSDRSVAYRAATGTPLGPAPALGVIVQVQVFARKAGVLFTVHPLQPERETAYVEANFGTGESVVGGLVTPDTITISRSTGEIEERRVATKRRMTTVSPDAPGTAVVQVEAARRDSAVLADAEARALLQIGLRIEELAGRPQDVEWAIDARQLWILQSRPITGPERNGR